MSSEELGVASRVVDYEWWRATSSREQGSELQAVMGGVAS